MGPQGNLGNLSKSENAGHIGHISREIAPHIDHYSRTRTYHRAVGSNRQTRVGTCASHCKIVGGGSVGILADEHIAHEKLH